MDYFESNYATLAQRAPVLAQQIRTALPPDGVETCQSRTGTPVFRVGEITLHSLYDPQAEESQWAARLPDGARPCVVLGFGNGYHLEALDTEPVIVVEPDISLLRQALAVRDLTAVLRKVTLLCPATAQQAV